MKTPIDIVRGKIVDVDEHGVMTIKAKYDDWRTMLRRDYKECNIQMIDSRPLSDRQRKTCYKLLREISNFTGMGIDPTKEYLTVRGLYRLSIPSNFIFECDLANYCHIYQQRGAHGHAHPELKLCMEQQADEIARCQPLITREFMRSVKI